MQCPKCGNTLRSDMYCEHCKEFLFNMDKPQKGDVAKSWLKIFSITVGAFVVVFGLIAGIVTFQEKQAENREIKAAYSEIQSTYEEGDYVEVLNMINDFNKTYNGKNKNLTEETNNILQKVEEELYKKLSNNDDYKEVKRLCSKYLESYPEGKYVEPVTKILSESSEKLALEEINTAKEYIENKDYLEADNLLQNVINSTNVAEETIGQAKELADSIANRVATEKAKKEIIGTWKKATGVCYTFEEDGRMSVSLPGNYDKSAGTTLDGYEVTQILKDIEIYGRPRYGGTWEYIGQTEGKPTFRLYQQGSPYLCLVGYNESYGTVMGIQLENGLGGISFLFPQ